MTKVSNPLSLLLALFISLMGWNGYGQNCFGKVNKYSKFSKQIILIVFINVLGNFAYAQPFIRTTGGIGQYGYIEKDATITNFLVGNGGYGNIFQYGVRTYVAGPNTNNYNLSASGSCARGDDTTSNFSTTINAGNILYSSVFVEYCGPSYSHTNMTPTSTCFNERSFFVMDVVPKTDALTSNICYSSTNSNVVLTFTISNNNTVGQVLNRLWISNDGGATEGTDINNDAFVIYYEAATGSETFNGSESSAVLYGDWGGNSTSNNEYGNDSLGISIPQNTTGGLRCYVVLRGSSTYLNASAKTKTIRMSIMADGISISPTRDTSFSKLKIDLTQPSTSYFTINDIPATPGTITGTTPQCTSIASQVYSVTAVSGASTYAWTAPTGWSITAGQGTNSITVTTGSNGQNGNITVTAGNTCGTSAAQIKAVTVVNTPPTIASPTSTAITYTTATLGGNISSIGCSNVTERGIYYSPTNGFADGAGTKVATTGTFGTGTFTQSVTGLTPGTIYYYKAFATNSSGTVYTTQGSFTTVNAVTGAKMGVNFNNGGATWRYTGAQDSCDAGSSAWSSTNLGSLNSGSPILIVGANMVAMPSSTSTQLFYRVYKQGDAAPSFISANLTSTSATCGSGTKYESAALNISLDVSTYTTAGTYNFEVYHQATNGIAINMGTSGSPFTATFTVTGIAPIVAATTTATAITTTTATSGGNITSNGGLTLTERGIVYSTSSNPTTANTKVIDGATTTGSFSSNIMGLNSGVKYYIRAYAINSAGTTYGSEISFTTDSAPILAATTTATAITSTTATSGGNITADGGKAITERGIVYGTNPNPDITNSKVVEGGITTGVFTSILTGLTSGLTYYVRAFATNSVGTAYGTQILFTTDTAPILDTTAAATAITSITATSGGNVTSDGGDSITERGIIFSTAPTPVIGGGGVIKITATGTTGSYSTNLTGLTPLTLYHVRSYATNSVGTTYGSEISFTTTNPIYSGKAYFSLNSGSTYFTGCNVNNTCDPGGNGAYDLLNNVVDVGSLAQGQNINIGGNLIQSGTVFTTVTMYFRVYKSGNTAPAYSAIALVNNGAPGNGCNSADTKWERPSSLTSIVAGLNSGGTLEGIGTYMAEIYYTAVSGGITYTWYKTGVTPFQATFTVTEDIFSAKIAFKIGTNTTWYSANHNEACDPGGNASFNSKDFGVVTRDAGLSIGGNSIANTAITGANLKYRVYSTSIADPSSILYQTINLADSGTTSCSGKTKKEQNTPQIINPSFFATDGDYFIEAYFEATDATGAVYFNNSGSNFKARISLYLPTPAGERDANDGNYDPTVTNSSGIYESYIGILVKDESGNPISGLNRVFDMDGALSSSNGTNFDFGTQNPGLSFNVGTETKIFTKGTHTDCGCSSWYYVYKSTDSDPIANDFPLPASGSLFTNQINGKFTLLNSSINLGTNEVFTRTTGESATGTTYTSSYNALLTDGSVNKIKYKDYTDPVTGVVSTIKIPVNSVLCPTCSGTYKVAVAMLAWVSTNGNCNDVSSLIYHRDINKNKITDSGVVLNPNHPNVPASNAGSPSKNTLPGTNLFYISKVAIGASNGTKTWNNGVWTPSGNPTTKNNVTLSSDYSTATNGSFSCNDMTVNTGKTLTITNGNYIEALNTVTTSGTAKIIIENSANFVQRCDEKTPSAYIEHTKNTRSMSFLDYVYWGSPVLENAISQFPSDFDWKFRWQSGTNGGWQNLTATTPAEGFITRIRTSGTSVPVTFTGTANNGILKTPVINYTTNPEPQSSYSNYLDYALVANPYPSAIDAKTFLSNPNNDSIESTLYFWTSITPMINGVYLPDDPYLYNYNPDDYATWNFTGGTATAAKATTAAAGVLVPTGKIASGQGFFVEIKKDGDVYFDNSMRLIENVNTQFFKKRPSSKELFPSTTSALSQLEEGRIWLNVSNKGNFRQLLLGYVNGATNNYDSRYDGLANTDSPISIYTMIGNKDLVIQGRQLPFDENEIVPVGYETSIAGDFYFNIDNVDGFFNTQNIFLKDNLLGTEHDLKQNAYLFSTEIGRFDNRFELKFTSKVLGINKPSFTAETVLISTTKDQIKINSTTENIISATVYDLTGKNLLSKNNLNNTKIILDKPTKLSGVFIVKVRLENNKEISKKVIF